MSRFLLSLALLALAITPLRADTPFPAKVSGDGRYLLDQHGKPFFWLADTAWELFHRLDFAEADAYLKDRADKRFTVVQAVALAEYGGLTEPNRDGHLPLKENDPARPIEDYFKHVDRVVARADELGLVTGLLPTWGDKWNKKWGQGPEVFTPENSARYGEFLGKRYKDRPVVWILGGDRPIETDAHRAIIAAMADGLRKGDGGRHLITFHPNGGKTSAEWLHDAKFLDFNMLQSGHRFDSPNYDRIAADYGRKPAKPCLDGEPGYEDHPSAFKRENGYLIDYDARKAAYWALFAGACGHTYGCHDVWQFYDPAHHPAITVARTPWRQAIHLPGASQMQHARKLIETHAAFDRTPDQTLIVGEAGTGGERVQACRLAGDAGALVYVPIRKAVRLDLAKFGDKVSVWRFDPSTGKQTEAGTFAKPGKEEFQPPTEGGYDWVLVVKRG